MPNKRSDTGCQSAGHESATDIGITERRKRLAQLIGRLLAKTWLRRHRQVEKNEPKTTSRQTRAI